MTKRNKSVARLITKPADFAWGELLHVMDLFGYQMKTTGGSGRKFIKPHTAKSFMVHEPHPQKLLKAYQVREVIAFLKQEGHL